MSIYITKTRIVRDNADQKKFLQNNCLVNESKIFVVYNLLIPLSKIIFIIFQKSIII